MDSAKLNEIVDIFNSGELSKLKLEEEGFSLTLQKDLVANSAPKAKIQEEVVTTEQKETPAKQGEMIVSPMVGTYYQASSPASQPFLQVGDMIKKGQPIAIIEAMKIMNEIEAEFDCKIVSIMVEDGQPVEFNTPLFEIERV